MVKTELALGELSLSFQRSKDESPSLPKAAPWLVIPYGSGKGEKFQAFCNIFDPNKTTCRKSIPELKGKSFYQKNSYQGWLIVLCDDEEFDYTPWKFGDCFLWNPLLMETINLPCFLISWISRTYGGYDSYIDCVLSSPPKSSSSTRTDDGGDSMVFMLFTAYKYHKGLVFCYPGGDRQWRYHLINEREHDVGELQYMCYLKGKLHIMCRGDTHLEIDMQHGSEPNVLSIRRIKISCGVRCAIRSAIVDSEHTYYVESSDEIFRIIKVFSNRGVDEYCVLNMEIAKLDFSSMSWVEVTSLDDHVFFLNRTARLSCSAKELGLAGGCVYFTQPGEINLYKYELEDNSIMISLPCPDLRKPWFSPNWLMIPTTLWIGEKRRVAKHFYGDKGDHGSKVWKPKRRRISENEDVEEARPWVLDDDMVRLISTYLNPLDYVHFRAVCKNHCSIISLVNPRRSCSTRCLQATNMSPWLVFSTNNESVYNFINPMHDNESYLTSIPELLQGCTIGFSKDGWLLMLKGYDHRVLYFYNPFTKAIIKLPDLPADGVFSRAVIAFSSLPTSSDCVVLAISGCYYETVIISFIKRGDEEWKYGVFKDAYKPPNGEIMYFEPRLNSPVFHNGAFYCLDVNGILGVCTLENGIRWEILSMVTLPDCDLIYTSYLVESEGKLLSVLLGQYGEWVRVFRLELAEMVWIEVKHLGRHMLFISNTSCITATAPTSQMENKIYFPRLQNGGILFYSLDSGTYHSLESEHSGTNYCNSKELLRCSWIEPNWSETTQPNR